MLNQGFTVFLVRATIYSNIVWSSIEMTINCASKDTGGLWEKTENAGASESWMQINHLMTALREKLDQVTWKRTFSGHVDLGRKKLLNDEQDFETLANCLFEWIPKIWENDPPIINLATG